MLIEGIETGNTKFVGGIGTELGDTIERITFLTIALKETIAKVTGFHLLNYSLSLT